MLIAKIFAAALLGLASFMAHAQPSFATKPVRIIVPYPPGGGIDVLARALGPQLSQLWGQSVIVENVAGAGSKPTVQWCRRQCFDSASATTVPHRRS